MTRLVFVHGRSQEGSDPLQLRDHWVTSLKFGLEKGELKLPQDLEVVMPFYGDKFAQWVKEYSTPGGGDVSTKGIATDGSADELVFTLEVLQSVALRRGITDEQLVAELGEEAVTEKGLRNWDAVLALLRLLDRIPGFGEGSISIATRDVWLYLTEQPLNNRVQNIVAPSLAKGSEDIVVVAHSLGSIIAYNALHALQDRSHIKGWVTVGSPLGIPAVYSRLPSFMLPRRAPNGVRTWLNARDTQDTVALYDVPSTAYPGSPVVVNHSQVQNLADNQHGIADYLADPRVAATIYQMVKS